MQLEIKTQHEAVVLIYAINSHLSQLKGFDEATQDIEELKEIKERLYEIYHIATIQP